MTTFIRVLEAAVDEKAVQLKSAVDALREDRPPASNPHPTVFECDPKQFSAVPGSPFAYWVSEAVRKLFVKLDRFEADGRTVKQGLATADDFRFVRAWWEVEQADTETQWFPFAKGGEYSPYYADVFLCVNWEEDGAQIKNNLNAGGGVRSNVWMLRDTATKYFFRPGLTWPLRAKRFSPQPLPAGCIFSVRGYCAFTPDDELLRTLGTFNSSIFDYLFKTTLGRFGFPEFIVGVLQRLPWRTPDHDVTQTLGGLARRAWSLKRSLDTVNEISHAFVLPSALNERITGLDRAAIQTELAQIQQQTDHRAFELYGIGAEDRAVIESSSHTTVKSEEEPGEAADDEEDADTDIEMLDAGEHGAVISWLIGVAFGRFDPRLATGERAVPPEPEPFDRLPIRSPGMWPEGEAQKDAPDILVDDEGHGADLTARLRQIAERVHWQPPENLRAWLAREFFPLHIKMYSKSRRKAPIYWQLATPSGSYSVWLYIHAFTQDTLFRVQHDYADPKLLHEARRLESLRHEFGASPSAAQRRALDAQERFVAELRSFLEEIQRIAPLWNPDLDDGVIINFAPVWQLVPQCPAWQRQLKSMWDELCAGEYDWAHLAMRLWPERVLPKCAEDRSLAIAHGLEEVFWVRRRGDEWEKRETPTRPIAELIRERTSQAVKDALDGLLRASTSQNGRGQSRRRARAGSR